MLQQTTVSAVIDHFNRFFKTFPTIASLAEAREEEVLKSWAGLGYYSRARNLHKAARKIVAEHQGQVPAEYHKVLDLPGIGRYTAGAILSIAYGKRYAVLDGNVMRVFSRFYGIKDNVKEAATSRRLWELAEGLVPEENPGDWNQALMELGATICLPDNPKCPDCPLARACVAFKKGLQDQLPVVPKRREFTALKWISLWIEKNGRVLLWKRSKEERFLKGHWGLPEDRHLKITPGRAIKTVRHVITHHQITVELREAAAPKRLPQEARWVDTDKVREKLVSSLWIKALPPRAYKE